MRPPARAESAAVAATRLPAGLLLVLSGMIALQPLSTDLYLPSLPAIAQRFGLGAAAAQQTLTAFILGFALAQLVAGPLADRFGRRPVVIGGLVAYVAGSLLSALAWDFGALLAGRLAQSVGVCCTVVCARAVVRDLWEPDEAARTMARMFSWMAVAIILGPMAGGLLQAALGWRAAFGTLAALGVALLAAALARLPETNRHRRTQALSLGPLARTYREVLGSPAFRAYVGVSLFSYAALFAYLAGSSFVLIRTLGLSERAYGLAFGLTGLGYFGGTLVARRVVRRLGLQRATYPAAAWMVAVSAVLLGLALAGVRHWAAVLVPMTGFLAGHALLQPCAQAGSVGPFPRSAGAAAALAGALTLVGAALHLAATAVAGLLAPGGHDGVVQLAATVFAGALGVALVVAGPVRRHGRMPEAGEPA